MEEIEHVIMEETSGGEETDDDFYEKIEAPKFVDLTGPDLRPEGDDRYWFCARVGCDRKHEEEMDSEAIYKNFVLRVMAARSPSVRLRKALCRKDSSSPKCPNTVPAKPSRSRVSRLAMISSIPLKAADNARTKAGHNISRQKHSTPKSKAKEQEASVAAKALTTPKNKQTKRPLNPRATTLTVPKDRVVAKALVFHSPKKTVKLKRSMELRASVKKLCDGMRKLEIANKRHVMGLDHKKSVPCNSSRRALRGREVKSRVFDSWHTQKQKGDKVRSPGSLKKRVKGKEESKLRVDPSIAHEVVNCEASDTDIEKQSSYSTTVTYTSNKTSGYEELSVENKLEGMVEGSKGEESGPELKPNPSLEETNVPTTKESGPEKANQYEAAEIEDKENKLPLEGNEKENSVAAEGNNKTDEVDELECDDKENASASDNNRKINLSADHLHKKKAFRQKETCKATQKVGSSARAGAKYEKPKPTNPKPFRFRTDERGILKEANPEKKQHSATAKEETAVLSRSKHRHTIRMENGSSHVTASKGSSTKLLRLDKQEESSEKAKPLVRRKRAVSPGTASCRKKRPTPTRTPTKLLEAILETSGVAKANEKVSPFVGSNGRRGATVPREPNFHSIHVPKSCTRRVASQV